jgi:hypothetical protein
LGTPFVPSEREADLADPAAAVETVRASTSLRREPETSFSGEAEPSASVRPEPIETREAAHSNVRQALLGSRETPALAPLV